MTAEWLISRKIFGDQFVDIVEAQNNPSGNGDISNDMERVSSKMSRDSHRDNQFAATKLNPKLLPIVKAIVN